MSRYMLLLYTLCVFTLCVFTLCVFYVSCVCSMDNTQGVNRYEGPYELTIDTGEVCSTSSDSDYEDESLCDIAISSYYPPEFQSKSFIIKPFLKELLRNERRYPFLQYKEMVVELNRIKSGHCSPGESKDIRIHALMLQAAHESIEEKEKELEKRFALLKAQEERIKKKMSKKYSALITAGVSFFTTSLGAIIVYLSK